MLSVHINVCKVPLADITARSRHVRFTPVPDISLGSFARRVERAAAPWQHTSDSIRQPPVIGSIIEARNSRLRTCLFLDVALSRPTLGRCIGRGR